MSKIYPERLNRDFHCSESNEKLLSAYDKVIMEDMKQKGLLKEEKKSDEDEE